MDDYNRDADSVIILDFDLDKFELTDEVKCFINSAFSSDSVNKYGHMRLSGHSEHVYAYADKLGCDCVTSGAYNGFFKNDENRLVFEFCEGDISLILCENEKEYRAELDSYYKFYDVEPDEVCIRVFFDGVHMDSVFVPENKVDVTISSIVQNGYDNYNGAVKEDWERREEYNANPKLSFTVVKGLEQGIESIDDKLSDATKRSEDTLDKSKNSVDKEISFD